MRRHGANLFFAFSVSTTFYGPEEVGYGKSKSVRGHRPRHMNHFKEHRNDRADKFTAYVFVAGNFRLMERRGSTMNLRFAILDCGLGSGRRRRDDPTERAGERERR